MTKNALKKKMLYYYEKWIRNRDNDITTAYKKPSKSKTSIWNNIILSEMFNGGYDFRVISHNTFAFTVGYIRLKKGIHYFVVVTPENTYTIEIGDLFS